MTNEHPPHVGLGSSQGDAHSTAQGILRNALGALRNLAELLRSTRVAPKAVASVLPHVVEACTPMREATGTLLDALSSPSLDEGRIALHDFLLPRLSLLEEALREAATKPMSAASRIRLEEIVGKCSFELDAARELLQMLEESSSERSVYLEPTELVREAFTSPPSARGGDQDGICAVLTSRSDGLEIDTNPRVAMTLLSLGVELVAQGKSPSGDPTLSIHADPRTGGCRIEVSRFPHATGEPLILIPRGVIEPTLTCLRVAARMGGGRLDWDEKRAAFSLSYPLASAASSMNRGLAG
ncbi:MAG: hypothetical protein M3020_14080 [Myxococcota bacterium]|nr:hypothetical protein [Myxococcota bacterium]